MTGILIFTILDFYSGLSDVLNMSIYDWYINDLSFAPGFQGTDPLAL